MPKGVPGFKKGHSFGKGRPKKPEEVRQAEKVSKNEVMLCLSKFMRLSQSELLTISEDPTRPAMEVWIAKVCTLGIEKGDQFRLDFIFNRLIGKVTDKIEHAFPKPTIIERLDGSQTVLGLEEPEES